MKAVMRLLVGFFATLFLGFLAESSPVAADFFSRALKSRGGSGEAEAAAEDPAAPSGAANTIGSEAQVGSIIKFQNGVPFAKLVNNNKIPLVGYGVGNLQHHLIKGMVSAALQDDKKIMLIDTARASSNEDLVAAGIVKGVEKLGAKGKTEVHVVTKVWYTHLGYERTKISVKESVRALQAAIDDEKIDLKLHILIHWPRCYPDIPWMNCEEDEKELPDEVHEAGPDPALNPDSWKESWRALEDLYLSDEYPIASIGLSNFHLSEIEETADFARIRPHLIQVNLWSLLYDSQLVDYCHQRRIHVQVYNAMQGTVTQPDLAPKAFHHVQKVARDLSEELGELLSPAQVILAWLIQHGISVIPRTSSIVRLEENSAVALSDIPALSDHQVETIAHAIEAFMSGDDLKEDIHVSVTFHSVSKDVMLYWMGDNGDESSEVHVTLIKKGESFEEATFPGHKFRTYDSQNKDFYTEHEITANFGESTDIHVEL
jgi:diketogulonate reductase-like aldo/keto reductase